MDNKVRASQIADFLKGELIGSDIGVFGVCPADKLEDGRLAFLSKNQFMEELHKKSLLLVCLDKNINTQSHNSYIKVVNPRLSFAKAANNFFVEKSRCQISPSARIGDKAEIGFGVSIGENCVIGKRVKIGENTVVNHNVVVYDDTIIGRNCYIKSGCVIGEEGFGFDFEEDGLPVRLPHFGRVVIGDHVEVGSNTVVVRGTLGDTLVNDNVKIDDHVFVAHNCVIGENTLVIAHAEISGSVKIGKNCWIGPNCSIIQKIRIGDKVKIGIGAVVVNDVPDNQIVMGVEALPLRDLIAFKKKVFKTEKNNCA